MITLLKAFNFLMGIAIICFLFSVIFVAIMAIAEINWLKPFVYIFVLIAGSSIILTLLLKVIGKDLPFIDYNIEEFEEALRSSFTRKKK